MAESVAGCGPSISKRSGSSGERAGSGAANAGFVASSLNFASNEQTKVIAVLDESLKNLNLGLAAWVTYSSHVKESGELNDEQIGYSKINGKWGISLQRKYGNVRKGSPRLKAPGCLTTLRDICASEA